MGELPPEARLRTLAIHAGQPPESDTGASAPNLVMSNTFVVDPQTGFSAESFQADAPHFYSRWSNPTVARLEAVIAALEGAQSALCFSTGMAAATGLLLHLLKSGDHLLVSDVTYAGVSEWAHAKLPELGIEVTGANMADAADVRRCVRSNTKLIYCETPCNPILRLTDIDAMATVAHAAGAQLAVDSTFATPIATRPLDFGADYVVHSLSKYIGGHGDALGGAVVSSEQRILALRKDSGIHLGGSLSPFNAWLILRGVATLPLRMEEHSRNALTLARTLEQHPKVSKVIYPGLPTHPQSELARRQMRLTSGMLTFQPAALNVESLQRFVEALRVFHYAVSLGHCRSLVFYLPTADLLASSFRLDKAQQQSYRHYAGEGIFRVSVGLEDPTDLCQDLTGAINAM